MKKYFTLINDGVEKNVIELFDSDNATVNGTIYMYEYKFLSDNVLVLRINNKNYFLTVSDNEEENLFDICFDSKNYEVVCKSELDLLMDGMSNNKSYTKVKKEIKSPMPGIIKSLNIKNGQEVKKGDVLLVLEAMKMENEIKSARDGVIKNVNVKALSSVEKNELLLEFE